MKNDLLNSEILGNFVDTALQIDLVLCIEYWLELVLAEAVVVKTNRYEPLVVNRKVYLLNV